MSNIGIRPRNNNEKQIIEICTRAHDWLAKELGVESTQEFGRTAYWGKDAFHAGLWYERSKQSVLNFRNLYGETVNTMLRIIGHELRHAMQYKHGMLKQDQYRKHTTGVHGRWERGYWNDEYFSGAYRDAPWEVDARAYQEKYRQMITDAGIVSAKELDLILSGQRVTYYNEQQKMEEFENNSKEGIHWFKAATISQEQDEENKKLMHQGWVDLGYIAPTRGKTWKYPEGVSNKAFKEMRSGWDLVKKKYRLTYRKDAMAYLTDSQLTACRKDRLDTYWEAQKNILEFDEVELSMADVTY